MKLITTTQSKRYKNRVIIIILKMNWFIIICSICSILKRPLNQKLTVKKRDEFKESTDDEEEIDEEADTDQNANTNKPSDSNHESNTRGNHYNKMKNSNNNNTVSQSFQANHQQIKNSGKNFYQQKKNLRNNSYNNITDNLISVRTREIPMRNQDDNGQYQAQTSRREALPNQ